jgi:hypothetical protein
LNLKFVIDDVKLGFRGAFDVASGTNSLLFPSPDRSVSPLLLLRAPGGRGFLMGRLNVEVCDVPAAPSAAWALFALSTASCSEFNFSKYRGLANSVM